MEIITGVERRRQWRDEEKLRILAELDQPGVKISEVARRHDIRCRRGCGGKSGWRSLRLVQRAMTGVGAPVETTPWGKIAASGRPRSRCSLGRPGSIRSRLGCGAG